MSCPKCGYCPSCGRSREATPIPYNEPWLGPTTTPVIYGKLEQELIEKLKNVYQQAPQGDL